MSTWEFAGLNIAGDSLALGMKKPGKTPFYGAGFAVMLDVSHIADGYARGIDGTCAFCHGDPCAEESKRSNIAKFYRLNRWADTCPCCKGRPT